MSGSVLGLPSWLLLEPKSLLYPVEGVTCPEFASPCMHNKLQFDFKSSISVMIAIKVPSHSHGSTQCQVNFLLLGYWLLSLLFTHWQLYFYLCVIYLRRCWRGKRGTGICSFSVLGIGIFMSFITGDGNFLNATENGNCFLKIRTGISRYFVNENGTL